MTPDATPERPVKFRDNPDAYLHKVVRDVVRDELASLGGHLLTKYGGTPIGGAGTPSIPHPLGTLGGYLLEAYGPDKDAGHVAYRDPTPPAVGEPPTTTPGTDA